MTDLERKEINRREFMYGFGAFSFMAVFGISPAIRVYSPASNMCAMSIERKNDLEGQIKAAYLGVGKAGIDIGRMLSNRMSMDLQLFNMPYSSSSMKEWVEGQGIHKIGRNLNGKDIVVLVGSIEDHKFLEARKLLLDLEPILWTVAICQPSMDDQEIRLELESKEVLRVLRHSIYPLDHPEIFVQTVFDIWFSVKYPPAPGDDKIALCDLGI